MLINESIVFPPGGGSKMVPLPFPLDSFFMCVSRSFFRQAARHCAGARATEYNDFNFL